MAIRHLRFEDLYVVSPETQTSGHRGASFAEITIDAFLPLEDGIDTYVPGRLCYGVGNGDAVFYTVPALVRRRRYRSIFTFFGRALFALSIAIFFSYFSSSDVCDSGEPCIGAILAFGLCSLGISLAALLGIIWIKAKDPRAAASATVELPEPLRDRLNRDRRKWSSAYDAVLKRKPSALVKRADEFLKDQLAEKSGEKVEEWLMPGLDHVLPMGVIMKWLKRDELRRSARPVLVRGLRSLAAELSTAHHLSSGRNTVRMSAKEFQLSATISADRLRFSS